MPKPISASLKANLNTIVADEHPLVLLEIHHPSLTIPVRLVNDRKSVVSQGEQYMACPFELVLPDENESQLPRASLSITNIGRALTTWIDRTQGGMDAEVRIIIIQRSAPSIHEWELWVDLSSVTMDIERVSAQLTFDDILNKPSVPIIYNTTKTPALF